MVALARPRRRVAQTVALPVAIGGWDASSPIAEIPPDRAVELINVFPKATSVATRAGWADWATGLGAAVETVMPWTGPSSSKLFGAAAGNIYNVTSTGAVGGAAVSSMTNAQWQYVNFGNSGGSFLWICNGADTPRYTDGTSWSTTALTGITPTDVINVTAHRGRLFLVLKNSRSFGYLAPSAISGPVSLFDLGPLMKRGGYLMAIGSWTRDGGAGPDDYAVFVTSEGEAIVYAGTDPNSASTWSLVGVFDVGQPIGRRCLLKYGTDILMISVNGVVSLSRVVTAAEAEKENVGTMFTARIRDAFSASAALYSGTFGWSLVDHASTNALYVNVPIVASTQTEQYVMNALTGAWCRYTGINALSWAIRGNILYCGLPGGKVGRAFVASSDNSVAIPWTYRGAYVPVSKGGQSAHVKMLRPAMQSSVDISVNFLVNADFDDTPPDSPQIHAIGGELATWDDDYWDQDYWGAGSIVERDWLTMTAYGSRFSIQASGQASTTVEILSFDALVEAGSIYG